MLVVCDIVFVLPALAKIIDEHLKQPVQRRPHFRIAAGEKGGVGAVQISGHLPHPFDFLNRFGTNDRTAIFLP